MSEARRWQTASIGHSDHDNDTPAALLRLVNAALASATGDAVSVQDTRNERDETRFVLNPESLAAREGVARAVTELGALYRVHEREEEMRTSNALVQTGGHVRRRTLVIVRASPSKLPRPALVSAALIALLAATAVGLSVALWRLVQWV